MTITMVVLLSMATISLLVLITISIQHNRKQKNIYLFMQEFKRLRASCNLTLSSQVVLDESILGLDGPQRKLLFLEKITGTRAKAKLIDLAGVTSCLLEKHYTGYASAVKGRKKELRLQKLSLHLEMDDGTTEEIIFYNDAVNSLEQLTGLANKARHWEIMLGKLLEPARKIA